MERGKHLARKTLALVLAMLMVAGMMTVPAFAEETIPEFGVYIDEDFEGYDLGQAVPVRKDGGQFTRRVAYPAMVDGNMVWNVNPPRKIPVVVQLTYSLSGARLVTATSR